jgi:hypothetical protein
VPEIWRDNTIRVGDVIYVSCMLCAHCVQRGELGCGNHRTKITIEKSLLLLHLLCTRYNNYYGIILSPKLSYSQTSVVHISVVHLVFHSKFNTEMKCHMVCNASNVTGNSTVPTDIGFTGMLPERSSYIVANIIR